MPNDDLEYFTGFVQLLKGLEVLEVCIATYKFTLPPGTVPGSVKTLVLVLDRSITKDVFHYEQVLAPGSIGTVEKLTAPHRMFKHNPLELISGVKYLSIEQIHSNFGDIHRFPTSVESVSFYSGHVGYTFSPGCFSGNFEKLNIGGWNYTEIIQVGVIPSTVKHLGYSAASPIYTGLIPDGVETIYLGYGFKDDLRVHTIPSSVKSIQFSSSFTKTIQKGALPPTLTKLLFSIWEELKYPVLQDPGILPPTLEHLEINEQLSLITTLPPKLKYLLCTFDKFPKGLLPPTLETLVLHSPVTKIEIGALPESLTKLEFIKFVKIPLVKGTLPSKLNHLKLNMGVCSTTFPVLPDSLEYLFYGKSNKTITIPPFSLPQSLKTLVLCKDINLNTAIQHQTFGTGVLPQGLKTLNLSEYNKIPIKMETTFIPDTIQNLSLPNIKSPEILDQYTQLIMTLISRLESQLTIEIRRNVSLLSYDKNDPYIYYQGTDYHTISDVVSTLFPIQQPTGTELYYSPKHKQHGIKFEVVVNTTGNEILWLSASYYEGFIEDLNISRFSGLLDHQLDEDERILGDLGYLSEEYENFFITPQKDDILYLADIQIVVDTYLKSQRQIIENIFGRQKEGLGYIKLKSDLSEQDTSDTIINSTKSLFYHNEFSYTVRYNPIRPELEDRIVELDLMISDTVDGWTFPSALGTTVELVEFSFTHRPCEGILEIGSLPESVKTLRIDHRIFNHYPYNLIPSSVTELYITNWCGGNGDGNLPLVPKTVRKLSIPGYYEREEGFYPGCFPDSITCLKLFSLEKLEAGVIPRGVKNLTVYSKGDLDNVGVIPDTVETVKIDFNDFPTISPGFFPNSVRTLKTFKMNMGDPFYGFDKPGLFPPSLTELYGWSISNDILIDNILPDSVTFLKYRLADWTPVHRFPSSLTSLTISHISIIEKGMLPPTLKKLKLTFGVDDIDVGALPNSLTELEIIDMIHFPIIEGILPLSLKKLKFGVSLYTTFPILPNGLETLSYNCSNCYDPYLSIPPNSLPNSLQTLKVRNKLNQEFSIGVLPPNLKHLKLESCKHEFNVEDSLQNQDLDHKPKRSLHLPKNIRPHISIPFLDVVDYDTFNSGDVKFPFNQIVNKVRITFKDNQLVNAFGSVVRGSILVSSSSSITCSSLRKLKITTLVKIPANIIPETVEKLSVKVPLASILTKQPEIPYDCMLEIGSIPMSVKKLEIDHRLFKHDPHNLIPASVTDLIVESWVSFEGEIDLIPSSVRKLRLNLLHTCQKSIFTHGCFPPNSITDLDIRAGNTQLEMGLNSIPNSVKTLFVYARLSNNIFKAQDIKVLPTSIKSLRIQMNQDTEAIPESVENLELLLVPPLAVPQNKIPPSVRNLTILYQGSLVDINSPFSRNLESLTIEGKSNSPIFENGILPDTLKYFFIQDHTWTESSRFPQSLTYLRINIERITVNMLPPNLKTLILCGTTQHIDIGSLPNSLTEIQFLNQFSVPIIEGVLPSLELEKLVFQDNYTIIKFPVIPQCVTKLEFLESSIISCSIPLNSIPDSITSLTLLGFKQNQSFIKGILPSNLRILKIDISDADITNIFIPSTLEQLHIVRSNPEIIDKLSIVVMKALSNSQNQLVVHYDNLFFLSLGISDAFVYFKNSTTSQEGFLLKSKIKNYLKSNSNVYRNKSIYH
eukprot:gene3089-3864_t